MRNRILSFALCLVMVLSLAVPAAAATEAPQEPIPVLVKVYSNLVGTKALKGLHRDNVFYLPAESICAMSGAKTTQVTASTVTFSLHDGMRFITVTNDGKVTEIQGKHKLIQPLPAITHDQRLYISAADILSYMGATVGFGKDEKAELHMMVTMPYTVQDLFNEFADCGGYVFSWAEAAGKWVDPEDVLELAALDTVLLGYDANVLAYALPGYGDHIEKSIHEDALLGLLQTEGAELVSHEDPSVEILNYLDDNTEVSFIWIQKTMEWAAESDLDKKLAGLWSKGLDAAGVVVDMTAGYISSLETAKQFVNLTNTQKNLMAQTLCRVKPSTDLYRQHPAMFEAAREAQALMTGEYSAGEKAAWDGMYNLLSNIVELAVPSNYIMLAWSAQTGVAKLDPLIGKLLEAESNITFASECSDIRILTHSLLAADAAVMDQNNAFLGKDDTMVQKHMKNDMILSLKASLTARLLLLDTGWLTESAQAAMQSKATATAELLNKAQNAREIALGVFELNEEDISWIEKLACAGGYGDVVSIGGNTYYWRYHADSFESGGFSSLNTKYTTNSFVCLDAKGEQTELFSLRGQGAFAIAGDQLFYRNDKAEICSIGLDGKNAKNWGEGYLYGVTEDGQYVICTVRDGVNTLQVIDVSADKMIRLTNASAFVDYHDGVIYFTKEVDSEGSSEGKVDLWSICPDGSNLIHLYTTQPDLDEMGAGYGYSGVDQMRFTAEYIYFSYGIWAGTGNAFMGGKVVRVRYDGTGGEVVAGQTALVDGQFTVSADDKVTTREPQYIQLNGMHNPLEVSDGYIYRFDETTGIPKKLVGPGDYDAVGSALAGVLNNDGIVLVNFAEEHDGRVYYLVHGAIKVDTVWRVSRVRQKSAMLVKDLETGIVTVLYQF